MARASRFRVWYAGRMKIVRAWVIAAVFVLGGSRAYAYYAIGAGTGSCGTWTAERRHPNAVLALMDEQWVVGFLSGVGFYSGNLDPMKGLDAEAAWAWMDNYCKANPLASMADAAGQFVFAHPK
jgi:hypothetical protein